MNRITAAMAPTPPARPSIVSSQFIAFISSTSQATVAGTATHGGRRMTPPNGGGPNGFEMLLMVTPNATGMKATSTCPNSWGRAPRRRKSSQTARGTRTTMPSRRPTTRRPSSASRGTSTRLSKTAAQKAR
jgi:hypothetical protein